MPQLRRIIAVAVFLPPISAAAQVIQLPSIHVFGVETTVVVPDRGSMPLAGDGYAARGSSRFGPLPTSRADGVESSARSLRASVQIHDRQAAEEALAARATGTPAVGAMAPRAGEFVGDLQSIDEIRRQKAAKAGASEQQTRALIAKARVAQQAGKPAVADIYYRSALRQASQPIRRQIEAERATAQREIGRAATQKFGK